MDGKLNGGLLRRPLTGSEGSLTNGTRSVRLVRLLRLIRSLHSTNGQTMQKLMDGLGVSRRTVFRDLKLLGASGIEWRHDRATQKYIAQWPMHAFIGGVTPDEFVAMAFVWTWLGTEPAFRHSPGTQRLRPRIKALLPQSQFHRFRRLADRIHSRSIEHNENLQTFSKEALAEFSVPCELARSK